jgi:hypothetical protein
MRFTPKDDNAIGNNIENEFRFVITAKMIVASADG